MLFVMWMAWLVSEMGPASFDEIDKRHDERRGYQRTITQAYDGPARALMRDLQTRWFALQA